MEKKNKTNTLSPALRFRFGAAKSDVRRDADKLPPEDVCRITDIDYAVDGCPWHTLDVYYPKGTERKNPTILNIHGGGWSYGSKGIYQFYCMDLARRGFTVVSFNYRLSPEWQYPAPLEDTCTVLGWMKKNAERFFIDMDRLFIVGDSAGGQLGSQLIAVLYNKEYRSLFPFPIPRLKLRGAALNCGVYDLREEFFDRKGNPEGLACTYLPAGMGREDPQMDVLGALNKKCPPIFLMGSVNDPVSVYCAPALEKRLQELKTDYEVHWYGQDDKKLGHVFHVNIALPEANRCNDEETAFFRRYC